MRRIDEPTSRQGPGPPPLALEASEARFRDLIEAGADGMIVVSGDGTIVFSNPAAASLLGRPASDLVGQPFGVPVVPGETTEIDLHQGDGTFRIAEMRAAATTWRGAPAHLAALRDVTERRRAEDSAREAAATLRSFYDSAPMMMGVVERIGDDVRITSSNAATARFLGIAPDALDGQLISRLGLPPAVIALWIERYGEAERTAAPVRFVYAHETPGAGGGTTWLSATVGFIGRTPAGRSQFSYVVEDVTERKHAEEALQEAGRRKDEFLAMLAHELRNPLAAISNAVELAARGGAGMIGSWGLEIVRRQCAHLSRLIDDLMDVSRISRGKVRLHMTRLDALAVLEHAVEVVRPLIDQRGHELVTALGSDPLWVEADPTRLEQIVVNLLTNAAKYTEAGGHLGLSAAREDSRIVIRVRDDGMGIPPEKLGEMFELFVQGERHLARSEGGLGIGLTLVRKLAELHGGRVTARSDGPGKGSEFLVELPAAPAPEPATPAAPAAAAPGALSRILVVDDNRDAAWLTAELLASSGHTTHVVHDGRAALDAARAFQPDVVLLDIGLPGMDGFEVARALRLEPEFETVRIIAVSGYGEERTVRRSRTAGFDDYLVKPVDIEALLRLVSRPGGSDGQAG